MTQSYAETASALTENVQLLRDVVPRAMAGFAELTGAASAEGALEAKTKELMALAISIVLRCDSCIAFHMKALVELGASRDEVAETAGLAVYMGGGPAVMGAGDSLRAFDEMSAARETVRQG